MTTLDELRAYDTAAEIPYALRTYTTEQIGGNRSNPRKNEDGPDALPRGKRVRHRPGLRGVRLTDDDTAAFMRAQELFLTRTQPHLYEDWHVEMTLELAHIDAKRVGRLLADCHGCHTTQPITDDTTHCPTCGTEY